MDTFYNNQGAAIAYLDDNGMSIYLYKGTPVAWLSGEDIFSYSGRYLGWIQDGWVFDRNGDRTFFTDDAIGGPVKPVRQGPPVRGVQGVRPVRGVREVRPVRPVRSLNWSKVSGLAYFNQ
jgi:hypothetical protein